ncbi:uncharacterized protein CDV56_106280 [Aspergillus thermomutatus]|uniref:Uncharacterized protein n=1 Tax=Aspergillus thermomutatus TaxID=41047 RepID=A0A397GI86_ASPTH|nr:uncharacterized protein CDV56_106280 [Aspergillus thermomutatus]RHZ50672.1 hypothetical protein CDV56_106280 [Aspergillus thermomutatus]
MAPQQDPSQEIGSRHPFSGAGSHNPLNPQLPILLPSLPVLDYSLLSTFLEQADFQAIQMKRNGTAFFSQAGIWFIIDQSGLDTGQILVVDFKPNEGVANLTQLRLWYLTEYGSASAGPPGSDKATTRIRLGRLGGRELWTREIDRNAPGYPALEAQGRESAFDLVNLRSVCED